jgi:dipeptidyl-peptidase-3
MTKIERFGKCGVSPLKVDGFNKLNIKQKQLVFHLSEAGMYGRNIYYQQCYKHNLSIKETLEKILIETKDKIGDSTLYQAFEYYLKQFWIHVGIYDSSTNKRIDVTFTESEFDELLDYTKESDNIISEFDIKMTRYSLFSKEIKEFKNIQKDNVDVIAESGGNFYENLTEKEVEKFRKINYPKQDCSPQYGFNSKLTKNKNNEIIEEKIFLNGLYGNYIEKIIFHLEKSLIFTEDDTQKSSIQHLINFYRSGDPVDFDHHSLSWVNDTESNIYFINGLIESYEDPMGIGCTFESIVAFKNPEKTEKVNNIINNIQWFEDHMPFDDIYKKDTAKGLSASSITVASMAGATSPCLPLGICLPNSEWIREVHGSKSVNLYNVGSSRDKGDKSIQQEFFLSEYQEVLDLYGSDSSSLHTDLHEITGHGSGKTLKGVSNDDLKIYYSVIEEARADLVGLYFIADHKIKDIGLIDENTNLAEFTKAQYISYLTNGALSQLRRVELGSDLAQPHIRNRQLVSQWVLEKSKKSKAAELVTSNNKHYIKVNDIDKCRELFGELLKIIQSVKSNGDLNGAKDLVEKYGTKVNQNIHSEIVKRSELINPPTYFGFLTPIYNIDYDENGIPKDIKLSMKDNFVDDQLYLSKKYDL